MARGPNDDSAPTDENDRCWNLTRELMGAGVWDHAHHRTDWPVWDGWCAATLYSLWRRLRVMLSKLPYVVHR